MICKVTAYLSCPGVITVKADSLSALGCISRNRGITKHFALFRINEDTSPNLKRTKSVCSISSVSDNEEWIQICNGYSLVLLSVENTHTCLGLSDIESLAHTKQ